MSKKQPQAKPKVAKSTIGERQLSRTPEELRLALREHDIHTTADSQLQALGAIYRVGTHEHTVDLRTLLSAIGKVQNLISLSLRASKVQSKREAFKPDFFLNA